MNLKGLPGVMPAAEIARKLGISQESVKMSLKRAMKKLKDGRADVLRDLMIAREKERLGKDEYRITSLSHENATEQQSDFKLKNLPDFLRLLSIIQ